MTGGFLENQVQVALGKLKLFGKRTQGKIFVQVTVHVADHRRHMAVLLRYGILFLPVIGFRQNLGKNLGNVDEIPLRIVSFLHPEKQLEKILHPPGGLPRLKRNHPALLQRKINRILSHFFFEHTIPLEYCPSFPKISHSNLLFSHIN